ncbi:golgi SNAP receptor complex member 2 [Brevipalpus obovatus]|uniref:golgi SNAP receptor complex member 2 n=1 Tax=Brevipalpus obovatus TaxID=246614 RepID=UPI003D9EF41A
MNQRYRGGIGGDVDGSKKETAINLPVDDYFNREKDQLKRFHNDVDTYLDTAALTMAKLKDQRNVLSRGRSALRDIANQLGMSTTVMRLIENRSQADWKIFWCLAIIFLLFVMFMLYLWKFNSGHSSTI